MTKKITISVPDELHEKMQVWKKSLNFSRIFQETISDLIQKKEGFKKRLKEDPDMDAIIERLKQEKKEAEEEWHVNGKDDGSEFAKIADYETLQYAIAWEPFKETLGNIVGYDPRRDDILGDYFESIFDHYDEISFLDYPNHDMPNDAFCQWEAGWKEGILEFWDEIKDKL